MGCCVCHQICGVDVDDIFTYDAPKTVRIRDARLGLLQYAAMFFIAVYIVVFELLWKNSYLKTRSVNSNIRMTLQQPTVNGCNPNTDDCLDSFNPAESLQYCCIDKCTYKADGSCTCPWRNFTNFQCQYVDGAGAAQANIDNIVINTFRHEYTQERNASCSDAGCSKLWLNSQTIGRFMADIEDFTLLVDHAVQNKELGIARTSRGMHGWLHVEGTSAVQRQLCRRAPVAMTQPLYGKNTTEAPCYIRPNHTKEASLDYFTVGTLLQAMGLHLDGPSFAWTGHSLRYEGLTVTLKISYFDTWPWHGVLKTDDGTPSISYVYSLIPLKENPYKVTQLVYSDYPTKRVKQDMHGIYLSVVAEGQLGIFDLQTLLITVTTSLTLLALAATLVKYLAMKCSSR
eukprot:TRINITY_DN37404_c0_g1_i2.p1 TRINITY_DN37404_c0_g1~~TRINITY_DN37404_c0_g1_i2.p1  ORF type:complete len:413 (+),score=70.97 TRINITY_DN37404_c0_g1_i2:44-1240(+)